MSSISAGFDEVARLRADLRASRQKLRAARQKLVVSLARREPQ